MGVERLAVQRLHPLGVHLPQHSVVGHARRKRLARPRQRYLMRRRQDARKERHEHVGDAQYLGDRPRAGRHQAGRHQRITTLGGRGDRARTARRPTRPRPAARPPASTASPRAPASRTDCPKAPLARRRGPADPRSPAARTPAPRRRVPATARRMPAIGSTSPRDPYVDNNTRISLLPISAGSRFGLRFCGTTRVLPQAPGCAIA